MTFRESEPRAFRLDWLASRYFPMREPNVNARRIGEAVVRWLEALGGARAAPLFLVLALWLRMILLLVDDAVPGG